MQIAASLFYDLVSCPQRVALDAFGDVVAKMKSVLSFSSFGKEELMYCMAPDGWQFVGGLY